MTGTVANTDYDWFVFLRNEGPLEEVNFWQPSPRRPRLEPGTPFFFHLKKPHYAIGGFGSFARWTSMPLWLAWETFGRQNGAADVASLALRIAPYQHASGRSGDTLRSEIGCIMLSQPVFFAHGDWVRRPNDWRPEIVDRKTYDLGSGEGRRIFDECRTVAATYRVKSGERLVVPEMPVDRYGQPILVRPRLGQHTFAAAVTDAYGRACAVTSEHSLPALQAAHIRPYSEGGTHDVSNGLLLRADIHQLFDRGYVMVHPQTRKFHVSTALKGDFANGRSYYPLEGTGIYVPESTADRPSADLLAWHADTKFRR